MGFITFTRVSSVQKRGMGWIMTVKIKDDQHNIVGHGSLNLKCLVRLFQVLKILRDLKRKRQDSGNNSLYQNPSPASNISDDNPDLESKSRAELIDILAFWQSKCSSVVAILGRREK